MLDRLKNLGRIGSVSRNIIQRAQRLKVVALVGEKPAVANIAMSKHVQLLQWVKSENLSALFRDEAQVFDGALLDPDDLDSKRRKFDDLAFTWDSPRSIDDKSRQRLIL
jgi:hypothetical protein